MSNSFDVVVLHVFPAAKLGGEQGLLLTIVRALQVDSCRGDEVEIEAFPAWGNGNRCSSSP
jgi:hypothetical protein